MKLKIKIINRQCHQIDPAVMDLFLVSSRIDHRHGNE